MLCTAVLAALALSACDRGPGVADAQPARPATTGTVPMAPGDTSVPAADSVLKPAAPASAPGADLGRSNKAMTPGQESGAMPMPGQNNDHSAPVVTDKKTTRP